MRIDPVGSRTAECHYAARLAMKTRVTHWLPLALVLLLAVLTLWLQQMIESPVGSEPRLVGHDPDAVVDRFTVTALDATGAPQYRLSAVRLVHFADNDSLELSEPRFVKRDPGSEITVVAGRGRVSKDYKEAFFYDDVQLVRVPAAGEDELRVRTPYLHVLADRDLATTDRPVNITRGRSTLTGTGMEYSRKTGQLTLLSRVRGSFDAKKK
jgi:lipopolysaccharide export system protein LptC